MTLEDIADLNESEREAILGGLLSVMPMESVATVICRVYDSDEDIEQLVFLIETADLPEADME